MLNILTDHKNETYLLHSMEDLYDFSYRNHFSGFREVLRKQEVYGGTFPIPFKTNYVLRMSNTY